MKKLIFNEYNIIQWNKYNKHILILSNLISLAQ